MLILVKAMSNPRSALCKTSIMAASDIFNAFGEKLLDFTDSGAFDRLVSTQLACFNPKSLFRLSIYGWLCTFTVAATVTKSFSGQKICM